MATDAEYAAKDTLAFEIRAVLDDLDGARKKARMLPFAVVNEAHSHLCDAVVALTEELRKVVNDLIALEQARETEGG